MPGRPKRPKGPARFKKGEKPPVLRGQKVEVGGRVETVRNLPSKYDVLNLPPNIRKRVIALRLGRHWGREVFSIIQRSKSPTDAWPAIKALLRKRRKTKGSTAPFASRIR